MQKVNVPKLGNPAVVQEAKMVAYEGEERMSKVGEV